MELVYLWVKKYKNIKNQGFNFSPRFKCTYNEDTSELTIEENKEYISVFPENINITAIVGENGSGKSSIIEEVLNQAWGTNKILVYKRTDIFNIVTPQKIEIVSSFKYIIKESFSEESYLYLNSDIFRWHNIIDMESYDNKHRYLSNIYIDKSIDKSIDNQIDKLDLGRFQQEIYKSIFKVFKEPIDLKFNFLPQKIVIAFDENKLERDNKSLSQYFNKLRKSYPKGTVSEIGGYQISKFVKEYFENQEEQFFILIDKEVIKIILYDDKERNIFHLSHGERKQFLDFVFVYENLKSINDDTLILLDEPDMGIHPEWNRKYINELLKLLSNFLEKNFHIIITSHSPFILSDLPKENIIFLKDGEQLYPDIDTFGANIHTLLSHGFFMENGLMGEFAKSKIEEIKKFYELVRKSEKVVNSHKKIKAIVYNIYKAYEKDFRNIQKIIGEPFLKTIIKNYLDELEILFDGKKEFLNNEIKRLQEVQKSSDD